MLGRFWSTSCSMGCSEGRQSVLGTTQHAEHTFLTATHHTPSGEHPPACRSIASGTEKNPKLLQTRILSVTFNGQRSASPTTNLNKQKKQTQVVQRRLRQALELASCLATPHRTQARRGERGGGTTSLITIPGVICPLGRQYWKV